MAADDALAYCADQVRRLDRGRYQTALFAPAAQRGVVNALHAFDMEVARIRDLVSEPLLGRIRLQWWRDSVGALFDGGVSAAHPVIEALAPSIEAGGLTQDHFVRLLDARERELDSAPPPDMPSLVAFAEATSGSVAMLVMEALGHGAGAAPDVARRLGTAWGLTCIIRGVPREAREGHFLERSPNLNEAIEEVHGKALELVADARRDMGGLPRSARSGLLLATLANAALRDIRRAGFDPFGLATAPPPTARLLWAALSGRV